MTFNLSTTSFGPKPKRSFGLRSLDPAHILISTPRSLRREGRPPASTRHRQPSSSRADARAPADRGAREPWAPGVLRNSASSIEQVVIPSPHIPPRSQGGAVHQRGRFAHRFIGCRPTFFLETRFSLWWSTFRLLPCSGARRLASRGGAGLQPADLTSLLTLDRLSSKRLQRQTPQTRKRAALHGSAQTRSGGRLQLACHSTRCGRRCGRTG